MTRNTDILEKKAETLTEKLLECKKELREYKENLTETQEAAVEALRSSNHNEQYSRKRSAVKNNGFRLVDDVTKANVILINRLSEHQRIESAWCFNGSIYGKVGDKRMKFDITDDIDNKVKKAAR